MLPMLRERPRSPEIASHTIGAGASPPPRRPFAPQLIKPLSSLWERYTDLALVFATTVFVAHIADFIALEEEHLSATLACIDAGRQRRRIAELQRHVAFPLGLEGRHVDDDAAAGIRALAKANCQHATGDAEILHRAGQRKAVGRDDAGVTVEIDKALFVEVLRVHHCAVDVGEDLEFGSAADVVSIAARPIADDLAAIHLADLTWLERLDHSFIFGHAPNPFIALDAHENSLFIA